MNKSVAERDWNFRENRGITKALDKEIITAVQSFGVDGKFKTSELIAHLKAKGFRHGTAMSRVYQRSLSLGYGKRSILEEGKLAPLRIKGVAYPRRGLFPELKKAQGKKINRRSGQGETYAKLEELLQTGKYNLPNGTINGLSLMADAVTQGHPYSGCYTNMRRMAESVGRGQWKLRAAPKVPRGTDEYREKAPLPTPKPTEAPLSEAVALYDTDHVPLSVRHVGISSDMQLAMEQIEILTGALKHLQGTIFKEALPKIIEAMLKAGE